MHEFLKIHEKKNRWKTGWNSKRNYWSRWKIDDYVTENHWISKVYLKIFVLLINLSNTYETIDQEYICEKVYKVIRGF